MHFRAARPSARRLGLVVPAIVVLAALALGTPVEVAAAPAPSTATAPPVTTPATKPNVVLILTDDQRFDTLSVMPNVKRLLAAQGTTYTRAMVPTSLCCPSRSTILTGLYAHSSRLFGNGDVGGPRYGGWRRFHRLGLEKRTLGPALQAAGYRTALIGKYLNFFGKYSPPGYRPPGWDTFAAFMSSHGSYYAYHLSDGTYHGLEPQDYSTDVLASRATDFISTTPVDQPLFLYFAPFGPHAPYTPAPRDLGTLDGKLTPYTAATLHQPLRTMPVWMQNRRHFTQDEVDKTRQPQLEALMSIDDAVGSIVQSLQQGNRDRDTLFVFMSDNGYFWGEHTIIGKDSPYDASTRIPMVIRWDGHTPRPAPAAGSCSTSTSPAPSRPRRGHRCRPTGSTSWAPRPARGSCSRRWTATTTGPPTAGGAPGTGCSCSGTPASRSSSTTGSTRPSAPTSRTGSRGGRSEKACAAKAFAACRPVPPHFHW